MVAGDSNVASCAAFVRVRIPLKPVISVLPKCNASLRLHKVF